MEYAEVQSNEVEALRAIYMGDFTELPSPTVWKNAPPPPIFIIHLKPSPEFESSSMRVDVKVAMTPTYPASSPQITLENTNALHPKQLAAMHDEVQSTIKSLRGSELVFEVTSNLQILLDDYARKSLEVPSLEEDRLRRLKIQQDQEQKEKERKEKELATRAALEEQKFETSVMEELEDRRQQQAAHAAQIAANHTKQNTSDSVDKITIFKPAIAAKKDSGAVVVFDKVSGCLPVPSHLFGHTTVVRPLLKTGNKVDLLLSLTHLAFKADHWKTQRVAETTMHNLNYELQVVREFRHPGVIPLLAFRTDRLSTGDWTLELLCPAPGTTSVDDLLDAVGRVSFGVVRGWAIQLLEALEHLHKAGIRHKCVCTQTIAVHKNTATSETSLLLMHPSYFHTLVELNRSHGCLPKSVSREFRHLVWLPPELSKSQASSKSDIWQFGVLLLQLIMGKDAVAAAAKSYPSSPITFVRSAALPQSLQTFLAAIFQEDPSRRPGALDLLTYGFLRNDEPDSALSYDAPIYANSALSSPNSAQTANNSYGYSGYSRYKSDFDEIAVLGRGGFGQVVKARNKLDGRMYAVKKIQATQRTLSHILQEVVLLSRLNHQYVVRYYSVWLENTGDQARPSNQKTNVSKKGMPANNNNSSLAALSRHESSGAGTSSTLSLNNGGGFFSMSDLDPPSFSSPSLSQDDFIQFGGSDDSTGVISSHSPLNSRSNSVTPTESYRPERLMSGQSNETVPTTLYIQMEYCEKHTLADLIKEGLYDNPAEYWRLFRQILEALAYIHKDGIIHRDLKPKNIFIDNARNIKIGDFGLAKSMVQSELTTIESHGSESKRAPVGTSTTPSKDLNSYNSDSRIVLGSDDMTTDIGTSMYAAVDMTASGGRGSYNEKVDMYSLGIIFFEMVYPMTTDMERLRTIKQLRTASIEVPANFETKRYSSEYCIVKSLLTHDPQKRPSASQLLLSGKIPVGDGELTIKDALNNLMNSDSIVQLTRAFFSRPQEPAQLVLYDRKTGGIKSAGCDDCAIPESSGCQVLRYLDTEARIRKVFKIYGAAENAKFWPRLFPRSALYPAGQVVELLDQQGTVLQLPYDLVLPHARHLAETIPEFSKTFVVGPVYRPASDVNSPSRHPVDITHASFDIVSTELDESKNGEDGVFEESETVAALGDVGAQFLTSDMQPIVVLGHSVLIETVLEHCGFPLHLHSAILNYVGLTGIGEFDDGKRQNIMTMSNISSASLDSLQEFLFREPIAKAEVQLRQLLGGSYKCVEPAIARLKAISQLSQRFSGEKTVYLSPLAHSENYQFYEGGVIMQLVDADKSEEKVLASGGRYDSLVRRFRHSVLDRNTPVAKAVGFSVNVDEVFDKFSKSSSFSHRSRCQVLIASFSESSLMSLGIELLRVLRANGIQADISRHAKSSEQLILAASNDNIPIVVVVKQVHSWNNSSTSSFKPLRVKNLVNKIDADMTLEELLPYVLAETPDRRLAGISSSPSVNSIELSQPPADSESSSRSAQNSCRAVIITESGKLKGGRKNLWQFEESCRTATAKYMGELSNAPAVTLDLRDEVIQAICSISPHAVDEWKRRVVGISPNQKAYIMNVQKTISTEAARYPVLLLYSTKTEKVFIYDNST